ncbi:Alpha/Beta hydrolase protein [Neocallimastix lanati (nom. inval.)]|uniref:Alpha/beta-hydrolase n=1 Tax=Neocallimastix californiae TaxID=1754190 RepID=A0A1Y2F4M1_9FUNG|nr:Alpha/Beta hydrolase protein [Neocallimastix sp. JGI-2020a]ORY78811.1 hypothetical protein LY90DRAFT_664975 [Neocallimastix californiae]|eukprot:ORY78811.1 hypothetical protein LY90DRAFT_664975 [Neocallimastix californiae]
MVKVINIKGRKITIYYNEKNINKDKKLPIVIYNSYNNDAKGVWEECLKLKCPEFILVVIEVTNWNNDMTPWPSDPVFSKAEGYGGKADDYITIIEEDILPQIETLFQPEYYVLAGYSLAGLFSIYAMFKTKKFSKFLSGSGSFWYPNFMDFTSQNKPTAQPKKIYLSLGNKEKKTGNKVLKTIETETLKMKDYLEKLNINTNFEFNNGGHFNDVNQRIANGILWLLK